MHLNDLKILFSKKDSHHIFLYSACIILMIAFIPFIENDYLLTAIYCAFIVAILISKKERSDYIFLMIGFFGLVGGEYFFIRMGVETFNRHTLLGLMPFWLPFLWAFVFLSMKRMFWLVVR